MENKQQSNTKCEVYKKSRQDQDVLASCRYTFNTLKKDRNCTICLDAFRCPKLLPCSHTFCAICLKTYLKKSKDKHKIRCPLCRTLSYVPQDGVDLFINNYFVNCAESFIDQGSCNLCKRSDEIRECVHCEIKLCSQCSGLHEQQHASSNMNESNQLDCDEMSRVQDDVQIALNLVSSDFIRIRSKVKLLSSFKVSGTHTGRLHGLCPFDQNKCWVSVLGKPKVILYDLQGREVKTIYTGLPLGDVIVTADDSLLVSVWIENKILKLTKDGDMVPFANCRHCKPASIDIFTDGRLVVAGPYDCDEETGHDSGTVQLYTKDGNFIRDIRQTMHDSIFEKPNSIAVNRAFGFICVSDVSKRSVFIISADGDLLGAYSGRPASVGPFDLSLEYRPFFPTGICCDLDGNILVCDVLSETLHVLNPFGELIGLLLINREEAFRMPSSIAVDKSGQIWLGDKEDDVLRVYEITDYSNNFGGV